MINALHDNKEKYAACWITGMFANPDDRRKLHSELDAKVYVISTDWMRCRLNIKNNYEYKGHESQYIKLAEKWFLKRGYATIFFCRFIPLIRSLISIPAGSAKMKLPSFLILTTLGTLIWNIVLVYLGAALGDNWEMIAGILDSYSSVVVVILGIIFILAILIFVKKRFFPKNKNYSSDTEK